MQTKMGGDVRFGAPATCHERMHLSGSLAGRRRWAGSVPDGKALHATLGESQRAELSACAGR